MYTKFHAKFSRYALVYTAIPVNLESAVGAVAIGHSAATESESS